MYSNVNSRLYDEGDLFALKGRRGRPVCFEREERGRPVYFERKKEGDLSALKGRKRCTATVDCHSNVNSRLYGEETCVLSV